MDDFNQFYNPLAQSVAVAKQQHQGMADYNLEENDDGAHEKLMSQKQNLENMLRDYVQDSKKDTKLKKKTRKLRNKNKRKDDKI